MSQGLELQKLRDGRLKYALSNVPINNSIVICTLISALLLSDLDCDQNSSSFLQNRQGIVAQRDSMWFTVSWLKCDELNVHLHTHTPLKTFQMNFKHHKIIPQLATLPGSHLQAYLASVSKHGVWRFGELLSANHLQDELLFGVSRKWVTRERVEST